MGYDAGQMWSERERSDGRCTEATVRLCMCVCV